MRLLAVLGSLMLAGGVAAIVAGLPPVRRSRLPEELVGRHRRPGSLGQARDRLVGAVDHHLSRTGARRRVALAVTRAGLGMGPGEAVVTGAALAFAVGCGAWIVTGKLGGGVVAGAGSVLGARFWVARRGRKRVEEFERELPEALDLLAGSLEAGTPIAQAMELVAREGRPPLAGEFARVLADHRLGETLADALDHSVERVASGEYAWCVRAVRAQQEFGASLADLLRTLAEFMRWRQELRGQVRALTAEGRLSGYVLTGLPLAMVAFFMAAKPDYLSVLVTRPLGVMMTVTAVTLMTVGALWMRRIVNLEV